jgi:hypothetical protein
MHCWLHFANIIASLLAQPTREIKLWEVDKVANHISKVNTNSLGQNSKGVAECQVLNILDDQATLV